MPKRIQRKRTKGWRMPEGAVYVGRPSKWGNPHAVAPVTRMGRFRPGGRAALRKKRQLEAVAAFKVDLKNGRLPVTVADVRRELAGRDLVCWCPLDQPCHADVWLEIANREGGQG